MSESLTGAADLQLQSEGSGGLWMCWDTSGLCFSGVRLH